MSSRETTSLGDNVRTATREASDDDCDAAGRRNYDSLADRRVVGSYELNNVDGDGDGDAYIPECPPKERSSAINVKRRNGAFGKCLPSNFHRGTINCRPACFRCDHLHVPLLLVLATYSIIGEVLRYSTEIVFSGTYFGTTDPGGAFFVDLPPNALGCFLMGLICSGDEVPGLVVDVPVAALPRRSPLQSWDLTHLGLRTGFCGSFTTFASWNAQMVLMLCGGDGGGNHDRRHHRGVGVMNALWGYATGLGMALASYVAGRHAALALHRRNNPDLAGEADALAGRRRETLAMIHRDLPDLERRFLHGIEIEADEEDERERGLEEVSGEGRGSSFADEQSTANGDETAAAGGGESSLQPPRERERVSSSPHLRHLRRWKETTDAHRTDPASREDVHVGLGRRYNSLLRSVERALLVDGAEPSDELLGIARDAGWDVESLRRWRDRGAARVSSVRMSGDVSSLVDDDRTGRWRWLEIGYLHADEWNSTEFCITVPLLCLLVGLAAWNSLSCNGTDQFSRWVREASLSSLLAPLGTILRWRLSRWNGSVSDARWGWLPVGTLLANVVASVISLVAVAWAQKLDRDTHMWAVLLLRAVKGGFAGCLSTVSTFAAETVGLLRGLPRHFWGYYYSVGSLVLACALGSLSYVWAAR